MEGDLQKKYVEMTTAPLPKLLASPAVPTMLSMLVTSLYVLADTYFVGRIDTQSTAAVGVASALMNVMQAIGFFFGHGSGNYISRSLGCRDTENAEKMAANGFFLAFITAAVLALICFLLLRPLCVVLGSTPTILPYARRYLSVILLGSPFMTGSFVLNNQMHFQGNARYAMWGILTGAIIGERPSLR